MQLPLRLVLQTSHYFFVALLLLHGAALASLFPIHSPLWLKLLVAASLIISMVLNVRHHALLVRPTSICELMLMADGSVEITDRSGYRRFALVSNGSTVLFGLTVLLLKSAEKRRLQSVVIFSDALSADEYRWLRSWLRWKIPASTQKPKDV